MIFETDSPDWPLLSEMRHYDPHRILGLHGQEIRLWRPGAERIYLIVRGEVVEAEKVAPEGLFRYLLQEPIAPQEYHIYHTSGLVAHDPYAFGPTIGELDLYLFSQGRHYELHRILGAHLIEKEGVRGVRFAVWAPNAISVHLIADCNHFDGRVHPMRSLGGSGVWELFVPGLEEGEKYKFEIRTRNGSLRVKSDPYAHRYELRPHTASIVADLSKHRWEDEEWLRARATTGEALDRPLHIYEVHLASWRSYGSLFPNYRQIAPDLAAYCVEKGYTHVELLPIMEHPFDESWGYQVTGFFAPTSRYGSPEDFQWFVDHLHQQGIGVILDWVPAHFPTDDFALNRFDGTALYEHEDPRKGIHPHWHTAIFNYGRNEVLNFLIASALFWIETMHVDGLRVDAVASIVYLDYGREAHHWIPNPDGSNFNVEGIEFLKHLNGIIRQRCPGVLMIAEESSSFTGVTHPGGLNFHLKWNMGWMNDTLRYMSRDPLFRRFHQNELTFSLLYAFSERFALVLSHDEVVHMKRSLLSKMPGPDWQKFANLRLLYSYQMCFPGKKLSFMGGELATWEEWDCSRPLPWNLLDYPLHRGIYDLVADLNHFYLRHPALWAQDFHWEGYEWLDFSDAQNSVIAYLRKGKGETLAIIHHFTPEYRPRYQIPLRFPIGAPQELFNTDDQKYGGSGKTGLSVSVQDGLLTIDLPPLATVVLRV